MHLTHIHNNSHSVVILFAINCGSNHEPYGQNGIAHLLEHAVFEGTQQYATALDVSRQIESVGGELNAMTSKNQTMLYVRVPAKYAQLAGQVLSQIVLYPTLLTENIEKEKQIICHEIDMYEDDPKYAQWNYFEHELFTLHPAKRPIAGTKEQVQELTAQQVRLLHQQWYTQKNSHLIIVGNLADPSIVTQYFEQLPLGHDINLCVQEEENESKTATREKKLGQSYYISGIKTRGEYEWDIIESILSCGQSGWLFDEFRTKRPLAYDVRATHDREPSGSYFAINVITDKIKLEQAKLIVTDIYQRLLAVSDEEIAKAKTYIAGWYSLNQDDNLILVQNIAEETACNITQYVERINAVSPEAIRNIAKELAKTQEFILQ